MNKRNIETLGPGAEHGIAGECFEHDVKWYSGGVECPVCKLEADLAAAVEALRPFAKQAKWLQYESGFQMMNVRVETISKAAELLARIEGGKGATE